MLLDTSTQIEGEKVIEEANKIVETVEGFIPTIIDFGVNLLIAIIIFFVGKYIIKLLIKILNKFFKKANVEISVQKFLDSLVRVLLYLVLLVIICGQIGIETTSFITVLGSAGLALGLALQGSLSNFAGGVLILMLKPFKVGDYIFDGSSGKDGTVTKIDLFYTYLNTVDNKKLIIPNGSLANTNILNASTNDKRRVDFALGISYSADIDEAKKVIEDAIATQNEVLKDEEIFVFIKEIAASSVIVGVRVWAYNSDYWKVYFDLNEKFKKALDKAGIEIPFNQLSVHIEKES